MASRRILYAGDDIYLPTRLKDALRGLDCLVVRSPVGIARMFIRSDIEYSLLLPTAADLAAQRDPVLARAAAIAGVQLSPEKAGTLFPVDWRQ